MLEKLAFHFLILFVIVMNFLKELVGALICLQSLLVDQLGGQNRDQREQGRCRCPGVLPIEAEPDQDDRHHHKQYRGDNAGIKPEIGLLVHGARVCHAILAEQFFAFVELLVQSFPFVI